MSVPPCPVLQYDAVALLHILIYTLFFEVPGLRLRRADDRELAQIWHGLEPLSLRPHELLAQPLALLTLSPAVYVVGARLLACHLGLQGRHRVQPRLELLLLFLGWLILLPEVRLLPGFVGLGPA